MVLFATFTFLVGAVLGLRFKALVLLPATAVCVAAVAFVSQINGNDITQHAVDAILPSLSLQFGYVFGLITSSVMDYKAKPAEETEAQRRRLKRA